MPSTYLTLLYISVVKYNRTPRIEINWDGYANIADDGYYSLKIGYIGGLNCGEKFYKLLF